MTKIQTILILFLLLVIIFSMDMIFGNFISNTFRPTLNNNVNKLFDKLQVAQQGNVIYSGSGLLELNTYYPTGDDQPLYFGFTSS